MRRGEVAIKRIHDAAAPDDGARILVDRLWPRGITKQRAALDGWHPEAAPSTALRQWFAHDPARFAEFRRRYRAELRTRDAALEDLRELARGRGLTLLFAAKDERCNHAIVLAEFLRAGLATNGKLAIASRRG